MTVRWIWAWAFAALLAMGSGCGTVGTRNVSSGGGAADDETADRLNVGDRVRVVISDIPVPPPVIEQMIPESGKLVLHLDQEFDFAGKKRNELEREIQRHYIDKKFYNRVVVNIEVLARPVTVGGEVRIPGVLQYHSQMTVTKAIDGAGGFTEFANRRKVRVTRLSGKQETVNCVAAIRNPNADLWVYPGDKITVERSIW
jgi:protein involved in polysaccharide export with SLBB domain